MLWKTFHHFYSSNVCVRWDVANVDIPLSFFTDIRISFRNRLLPARPYFLKRLKCSRSISVFFSSCFFFLSGFYLFFFKLTLPCPVHFQVSASQRFSFTVRLACLPTSHVRTRIFCSNLIILFLSGRSPDIHLSNMTQHFLLVYL